MNVVVEDAREVPVVAECDVCVVGGSCTGVFAAVCAARLGANVAIIENNGFLGGTATAGLVCVWHSLFDTTGKKTLIAGLTREVLDRLGRRDAVRFNDPNVNRYCAFNSAELTIELDELVREAGVRPFLHARFVAPAVENGELVAAVIEDKTGRRAVRAKVFVDATGDGDLFARAGLPFHIGEELQPPTACAVIRGIDQIEQQNPHFRLGEAAFDRQYPTALPPGFLWFSNMVGAEDERMVAGTRINHANCADADGLTLAEIEGRRQVRALCDLLRENFPGGEHIRLRQLPACIGIRETRRAECLHTLTESEVLNGVRFPDAIANGSYRVDVHHSDKSGLTFRYLDGTEHYVRPDGPPVRGRWREPIDKDPTFYQIPYRSLVPKGATNVLAAGRLIDADRGAYGAVRVMVNCNQTGEAAGTAAYLALDSGAPVADVDTEKLRETLRAQGSLIV